MPITTVLWLGSCVANPLSDEATTVRLPTKADGPEVVVDVARGPHWTKRMGILALQFNTLPNLAIWAETPDGTFVGTLYVTGADYSSMRHAGKNEGTGWWKVSLPVWSKRVLDAGGALPSPERPYADGVTSATPQSTFQVRTRLPADPAAIRVRLEVNVSGDYNATFPQAETDWVGQPSVVYEAGIEELRGVHALQPVGRGDHEAPGTIVADMSGLDSALRILGDVRVTFPD